MWKPQSKYTRRRIFYSKEEKYSFYAPAAHQLSRHREKRPGPDTGLTCRLCVSHKPAEWGDVLSPWSSSGAQAVELSTLHYSYHDFEMDRLPQEIIEQIVSHLSPERIYVAPFRPRLRQRGGLSRFLAKATGGPPPEQVAESIDDHYSQRACMAAVSRKWQMAVERVIFSDLLITRQKLAELDVVLSRPGRMPHLRNLTLVDLHEGKGLELLFTVLSSWEGGPISLRLSFTRATSESKPQEVHLDGLADLPLVECVTSLSFYPVQQKFGQLDLPSQAVLTARFPNLQEVEWISTDSPQPNLRTQNWVNFANAAVDCLPGSQLTKLSLALRSGLVGSCIGGPRHVITSEYEKLFTKLRIATENVTDLTYAGIVGPSFFPPLAADAAGLNTWPTLRNLTLCSALISTRGEWYFTGSLGAWSITDLDTPVYWLPRYNVGVCGRGVVPPKQHEKAHVFHPQVEHPYWIRDLMDEDEFRPLLHGFADFLKGRILLETAQIVARRSVEPIPWAVCYCAPGKTSKYIDYDTSHIDNPRVWFVTGDWRPTEEIVERFRTAASAGHDIEAVVVWWSPPARPWLL